MLTRFKIEHSECDFKQEVEHSKTKSWLKSVSASIVKNMNSLDNMGNTTVTPTVYVQETWRTGKSDQKIQKWPEKCRKIIIAINENKYVTIGDLEKLLDTGHTTIKKMLAEMQKEKYIRRVGADKGGYWEVLEIGE